MGYDLFGFPWVQQIVKLFSNIGWALFAVGMVVAAFEFAIEHNSGRAGNPKVLAMNIIKGFFAVNLFSTVPVELYGLAVTMQRRMSGDLTGYINFDPRNLWESILDTIGDALFGPLLSIFIIIMVGYSIIKVFFAGLKRGGILLIQIAIGSLYMFSVVRGYTDGFTMWVKQVIANCVTAFLQSTMLICGLVMFKDYWIFGLGVMLAAGEIPRIAGLFGLETAVRPNINGVINTAQSAVHLTTLVRAAAK